MVTIDTLKPLLGVSATNTIQDAALSFILKDVTETILNYCNLAELPSGLENTAYRMAIDLYRNEGIGAEEAPTAVSSIEEGGTAIQFKKAVDENFKDTLLKNYRPQLNRYRRVSWV